MVKSTGQWKTSGKYSDLFNSDKRKYDLPGGVRLMVDPDSFRYHPQSRDQLPTVYLVVISGPVSQTDAAKAAGRLRRVGVTATTRMIEVRTDAKINTEGQAFDLCEAFVDQLHEILRDRIVARKRAKKAASRTRFVKTPQK